MSMFSQRHYVAIAKVMAKLEPTDSEASHPKAKLWMWDDVEAELSRMFKEDNPQFDPSRFRNACKSA